MPSPQRIRTQRTENPCEQLFHTTAKLFSDRAGRLLGGNRIRPFDLMGTIGPQLQEETKATILRFYAVEGVERINLGAYWVSVIRAPAFDWDDLEPGIIAAIKESVGWSGNEVVIDRLDAA